MNGLKGFVGVGAIALVMLAAKPAMSTNVVYVTNNADAGNGSFRAAVGAANANPIVETIEFRPNLSAIELKRAVTYRGSQALTIDGRGTEIGCAQWQMCDLFVADGGGDLTLRDLTFRGGDNGVVVEVPPDAQGELLVSLRAVTIADNAQFGLLIDDLTGSSPATVALEIEESRITGNGLAASDLDGVRVDEGGYGDIIATVRNSQFTGNGADGLELDESDDGDVILIVRQSVLDGNGARFDITQNEDDADDGLDVDEAGDGSVWLRVVRTTVNDNTDDGVGVDELGNGSVHLALIDVEASRGGDKGISVDEGDDGDFRVSFYYVRAEGNGDDGAKLEETGDGDFVARVVDSVLSGNDEDGANFEEAGDGSLWADVDWSTLSNNAEFGIKVKQVDDGEGVLHLQNVKLKKNGSGKIDATGVEVNQGGPPSS